MPLLFFSHWWTEFLYLFMHFPTLLLAGYFLFFYWTFCSFFNIYVTRKKFEKELRPEKINWYFIHVLCRESIWSDSINLWAKKPCLFQKRAGTTSGVKWNRVENQLVLEPWNHHWAYQHNSHAFSLGITTLFVVTLVQNIFFIHYW